MKTIQKFLKSAQAITVLFVIFCTLLITNAQAQVEESQAKPPQEEQRGDEVIFTMVEEMPAFPGGDEARVQFITNNLKYPEEAVKSGVEGRVFVTFVIEANGSVTNAKVLRGIGGGCDEEAVRVIESMPRWNAGKQGGKPVRVQFNMPIHFALEKEKNVEQKGIKQPAKPEFKQIPNPK
jgi:TonB family protein